MTSKQKTHLCRILNAGRPVTRGDIMAILGMDEDTAKTVVRSLIGRKIIRGGMWMGGSIFRIGRGAEITPADLDRATTLLEGAE